MIDCGFIATAMGGYHAKAVSPYMDASGGFLRLNSLKPKIPKSTYAWHLKPRTPSYPSRHIPNCVRCNRSTLPEPSCSA